MRRYIAIALFLAACTKTSSPSPAPANTISASINGTPTTFNVSITVDTLSSPGTVYVVAHADSANLTPLFEITLGNTPLQPGTYPFTSATGSPLPPGSPLPAGSPFGLLGYTQWSGATDLQYTPLSDTVTLTTVTKTWFSGTFQGTCEYTVDSAASIVSITNGQFTVGYPEH